MLSLTLYSLAYAVLAQMTTAEHARSTYGGFTAVEWILAGVVTSLCAIIVRLAVYVRDVHVQHASRTEKILEDRRIEEVATYKTLAPTLHTAAAALDRATILLQAMEDEGRQDDPPARRRT